VPHLRGLPMTQDPKLNSHSKLNCILACIAAEKAGADEALMLDVHGFVNTTNACNFFIVRRGEVWTSTGDYCMPGITRAKVIEICRAEASPSSRRISASWRPTPPPRPSSPAPSAPRPPWARSTAAPSARVAWAR
jgi:branched-chain amino acid aminotransferase